MYELFSLISVVLAIVALSSARNVKARLESEIAALREEMAKMAEAGVLPRPVDAEAAAAASEAQDTPTMAAGEQEAVPAASSSEQAAAEVVDVTSVAAQEDAAAQVADAVLTPAAKSRESFESRLAARWTVWVGGLALAFAGIFAVKYSIDQGLLSPAVRLSLAAIFGLVLMGAGEFLRRRTSLTTATTFSNAMIPGILTAAGSLTLFGVVFAAHGIYGYIGPATAFLSLCAISLATLALSLLHGQALAGLGLVASFVTPLLVTSTSPSPWPLFGFLSVAWIGSSFAAKLRDWRITPAIANVGLSLWAFAYVVTVQPFEVAPVTLALLIMLAGVGFIWPGPMAFDPETDTLPEENAEAIETATEAAAVTQIATTTSPAATPADPTSVAPASTTPAALPPRPPRPVTAWEKTFFPPHIATTLTAAIGTMGAAISYLAPDVVSSGHALAGFVILTLALALLGLLRRYAVYPALFSAVTAFGGLNVLVASTSSTTFAPVESKALASMLDPAAIIWVALGLGAVFALFGIGLTYRRGGEQKPLTVIWAALAAVVPLALATLSYVNFGDYRFDLTHGLFSIVLAGAYLAAASLCFRGADSDGRWVLTREFFVAASWASFVYALMVMTNGVTTTLGIGLLGFAYLLAGRARPWPSLPWAMAASAIFVAGRIAWEPTIVGADHLGRTPVFNALLVGYGVPSLLLIASAFLVRKSLDIRLRSVMEALASLFTLLTIAILVRHAMNGGTLNSDVPTLSEQSIYTLLTIGASLTLMALDLRQPSIVFRTGSMGVGYLSMLSVIGAHYGGLNPYFTGESTGSNPVFNLLFLAYLLPGLAYGFAAWFARSRRPMHYVVGLALTGASLLFAYVSLSVRRVYHGADISEWKGFMQSELYTYSVVWLLLGVALLVLGYRFRAKSLRIASAVLVLIAVLKVFVIDMSNLEGLYRVLSFIGLGVALIGIGRFYQTILTSLAGTGGEADKAEEAEVAKAD